MHSCTFSRLRAPILALLMLNPQQRAAVEYCDGPLLVLAGAGSGKTRVITEKISHLISRRHLAAEKIAAITFTNKAAKEMRERVGRLISEDAAKALTVCTFHALGLKFLQIEHDRARLRRGFSVLDADDSAGLVRELAGASVKSDQLFRLRALLSRLKSDGLTPDQALDTARAPRELEAARLYAAYQKRLAAFNAVDFDDLIRLPVAILQRDEEARLAWRERIRYLLVDECQDTNAAQYAFLRLLAGERGAFTCVGDDDQSIYAWRGADPGNLDRLSIDYPGLRVIKLEQNYRCAQRVLRAANALIANNPHAHPKKLWSALADGERIRVMECRDAGHEAERVASQLRYLRDKHRLAWSDCAVLYRGNHQARPLEKALQIAHIPYHLTGALSFLDRAEVKDLLAYLRLAANPDDDAAFLRIVNVPRREIGVTTLEKLGELAQSRHLSLLRAARSHALLQQLASRPAAALTGFAALIDALQTESRRLRAPELAEEVLRRTPCACIEGSGAAPAQARQRARIDRLVPRDGHGPRTRGRSGGATGIAQSRRPRRRRRCGAVDDPACGQGSGIPLGAHRRLRGRHPAARGCDRRGPPRRGAPPAVRRHHPREAVPAPELQRAGTPLRAGVRAKAVALPRRTARRGFAPRRRRSGSRCAGQAGNRRRASRQTGRHAGLTHGSPDPHSTIRAACPLQRARAAFPQRRLHDPAVSCRIARRPPATRQAVPGRKLDQISSAETSSPLRYA